MARIFANTIPSVIEAPLLVLFLPQDQTSWCQQLSEEGYDVVHVEYPSPSAESLQEDIRKATQLLSGRNLAIITYGMLADSMAFASQLLEIPRLKACVHFCPLIENGEKLVPKNGDGEYIPGHNALEYFIPVSSYPPVAVYTYPLVPSLPPFPFVLGAPTLLAKGKVPSADPYIRSANGLSYTRTLELLRRQLGPHFNLEKLWERHTFYEFGERDALKTMSTMVATPYVNHVPTMTGGVGYEDLARFYTYHFTKENVTPPDTELITVSRTVGADRIIDEMIFKCTHTTEIDYFVPGVKPTGRPLEIALVGVIAFRGDKLTFEHIYWDQASVLVQLGLLDPTNLPVAGVEVARKVVDPFGMPSNILMDKWKESEGLPIN
ncbi:hypothetical protein A0H81_00821 [Grifola frondosa]|uniref:SnoaL-like domain-containing protein n=1 Tax=Grifola frondosa TaxID=5627 RepID=A0A1C7MRE2_GRIFR|nr:hypothetical protein A0H81_00821 [Grifola frondosa]